MVFISKTVHAMPAAAPVIESKATSRQATVSISDLRAPNILIIPSSRFLEFICSSVRAMSSKILSTSTERTMVLKKVLMSLKSESLMKLRVKLMRKRDCEMKKAITKKRLALNFLRLILVTASQKLFPSMGSRMVPLHTR